MLILNLLRFVQNQSKQYHKLNPNYIMVIPQINIPKNIFPSQKQISIYPLLQMQIQLNNIDFAIAVNTFNDDVEDKLQILKKIQLQFLRKFQHRVQISEYHSEMIFQIRKFVANIEEMYKDVRDYFVEMKVQFVYNFVRKIQTIMVIGYNHLSQALLITLDMYQEERKKNKQTKPAVICTCQTKQNYILSKDELKRLQHIDYTITSLQTEEQRLQDEMHTIYDRMMMQKGLIEKVKPSLATKQLQEMKDHIQSVMENNEKLFEETYMMKFFEFHNHIKKLDKPQKITQVYNKLNITLKQSFINQTLKAAKRIEHARRYNPELMHSVEVQTMDFTKSKKKDSPKCETVSIFSKTSGPAHNLLAKEKKLNEKMNIELNMLQKQNLSLTEELSLYKSAEKEIQVKYRQLVQRFSVVQGMYLKAKTQLEQVKREEEFQTQQLVVENKIFKQQIAVLRSKNLPQSAIANFYVQTDCIVRRPDSKTKSQHFIAWNEYSGEEKQTQTHEEYLLPFSDDDVIKLLKTRNQKAITMLSEKDRKIRDTVTKINIAESQTIKIKSTLNIFVGIVQEKFIGSKYASNDLSEGQSKKQSILEMNSEQIESKIKKVIQMIVPNKQDFSQFQNIDLAPSMQEKFKKVISIKPKPLQTLQDEQFNQNHSNEDLQNIEPGDTYSKTICNFTSDSLNQKKKKRLNVMTILGGKINLTQTKIDAACQTNFTQGNQDWPNNLQKKEICTQTIIDEKQKKSANKNNLSIRNSIEAIKQKALYQRLSTTKSKNYAGSNRNSERALSSRKNKFNEKSYLNTFDKIKIKDQMNQLERQSISRKFGRTGISEYLSTQRKMGQTSQLTYRAKTPHDNAIQTQEGFRMSEISPFTTHKDDKSKEKLSKLFDDFIDSSENVSKHDEANDQKEGEMKINLNTSKGGNFSITNKIFNVRQKLKLNKDKHNRFTSQLPSTFRPITQTSECDKENQLISTEHCSNSTMSKFVSSKFDSDIKMSMTSGCQFSKFKAEQVNSTQRAEQKKKTLLLSIQSYKPQTASTNELLLENCLTKMISRWGMEKIKETMNSVRLQLNS